MKIEAPHARQQQSQGRIKRNRHYRRDQHGQSLGIGQRLEHAAFLCFQRQHRQEAHRDHQQCEEGGARDFFDGRDHDIAVVPDASAAFP